MIQNLIDRDTVQTNRIQVQKRSNVQNQTYLRLQMKQRAENAGYEKAEKRNHVDVYEYVSSVESPEHIRKVNEFNMRKLMDQSKYQTG